MKKNEEEYQAAKADIKAQAKQLQEKKKKERQSKDRKYMREELRKAGFKLVNRRRRRAAAAAATEAEAAEKREQNTHEKTANDDSVETDHEYIERCRKVLTGY